MSCFDEEQLKRKAYTTVLEYAKENPHKWKRRWGSWFGKFEKGYVALVDDDSSYVTIHRRGWFREGIVCSFYANDDETLLRTICEGKGIDLDEDRVRKAEEQKKADKKEKKKEEKEKRNRHKWAKRFAEKMGI